MRSKDNIANDPILRLLASASEYQSLVTTDYTKMLFHILLTWETNKLERKRQNVQECCRYRSKRLSGAHTNEDLNNIYKCNNHSAP